MNQALVLGMKNINIKMKNTIDGEYRSMETAEECISEVDDYIKCCDTVTAGMPSCLDKH